MRNGFLYLVAIMGWASRKVLSWRLSNTMHAVDALNEAIAKYGPPEIMKTDQGSQFTGSAWITTLTEAGVRISMDGRGRTLCLLWKRSFLDGRARLGKRNRASGAPDVP